MTRSTARLVVLVLVLAVPARAAGPGPGARAPDFTLRDQAGREVALSDLRGKVVCLDFWASWCAPCKAALPGLDAIAARHAREGLEVVAVNIDGRRSDAERFLAEHLPAPAFRVLYDPGASVLARFAPGGMPALYLIDRTGIVRLAESGYDPGRLEAIEREAAALLAEDGHRGR
ncbi:MAG TPA: TlpA disulfide reductase family protein [Candidatus Binatus sp.]|nr:TlpA disulfide reductase family protein [Candidatus Binatus sp.]